MSLIDDYWDLEYNISALEAARASGRGQEFELYKALIAKGHVLLPYLTADGIAFGPSRFLGYANNSVNGHGDIEGRNGWDTTPRIRQVLSREFGFTIKNYQDDAAEHHFVRFCETLGRDPDSVLRTYWITPEVGNWLARHPTDQRAAPNDEDLEGEVRGNESLPETTREAIIKARVGQGLFRRRVLQAYGRCLITRLKDERLLVASHIKPWRDCRHNPNECLNPDNALLLSPTWDALFDKGFVSFADDGSLMTSERLTKASRRALGIGSLKVSLTSGQMKYMRHHRTLHQFE